MPSHVDDPPLDRRAAVLDAALLTFSRLGYRKASMSDVARDANLSRQGLYYLFSGKQALFSAAAAKAVRDDLVAVAASLETPGTDLRRRIVTAFDHWAGRYVGPLRDVTAVIAANPELIDADTRTAPARFERALRTAVGTAANDATRTRAVVRTLLSVSVGLQQRCDTRREYLAGIRTAVDLLVPADHP